MMLLVVLGDLMVDVVARASGPLARASDTPAEISFRGGGSGANVAAWAGWLGAPVAFVCRVGDDARGRNAVAELRAGGVDVRAAVDPERPTGTCVVLVEPGGERSMLPDPGANDGPYELPDGLRGHLHVSGYTLLRDGARPSTLAAIDRARAVGMTISIDPSSWALIRPRSVPACDLLLPNEDEAAVLAGASGDDVVTATHAVVSSAAAREVVAKLVSPVAAAREVVVKLGASGALWTDGDEVVWVPSEAVDVVDTTGAGDAFAAGLLVARLQGAAPREALAAGCHAAARAVAQVGARPPYD